MGRRGLELSRLSAAITAAAAAAAAARAADFVCLITVYHRRVYERPGDVL